MFRIHIGGDPPSFVPNDKADVQTVDRRDWLIARQQLRVRERELIQLQREVNAQRFKMPTVAIDQGHHFEGPEGDVCLLDLFEGFDQLVVIHVHAEAITASRAETVSTIAALATLRPKGGPIVFISEAPLSTITRWKKSFERDLLWYSAADSRFREELQVSFDRVITPFTPVPERDRSGLALSLLTSKEGQIYLRYSSDESDVFQMVTAYNFHNEPETLTSGYSENLLVRSIGLEWWSQVG